MTMQQRYFFRGPSMVILLSLCINAQVYIKVPGISQLNYTKNGDFTLGMVLPVHGPKIGTNGCSDEVRDLGLLQRLEALVYAVEEINNSSSILPNHTLGYSIYDDCYRDIIALAQALHFSAVTTISPYRPEPVCGTENCELPLQLVDVVGVIGSESSSASLTMAQLMTTFQKPLLSYLSTAPMLSNKNRFPYFSRVVSSDVVQAQVIVQLLRRFNWTYVSTVYAEGSYGTGAHKALQEQAAVQGICFSQEYEIKEDFVETQYRDVVYSIIGEPRSRVVVSFIPDYIGRRLLFWADRLVHQGKITWIAGDAWLRDPDLTSMGQGRRGYAKDVLGALSINLRSSSVPRFDEHFQNLRVDTLRKNPWINNYLRQYHNCSNLTCSADLRISDHLTYAPESTTSLAFDAVYAYAYALDSRVKQCEHFPSNTEEFLICVQANLTAAIRESSFRSESGDFIQIDENGDRRSTYDVYNVQLRPNGTYSLVRIAEWQPDIAQLNFLGVPIQWPKDETPVSQCSEMCEVGEAKSLEDKRCCWSCMLCEMSQIVTVSRFGVERCQSCSNDSWPDPETRTSCIPIVAVFVQWSDPMGIALTALAGTGIVVCFLLTAAFGVNNAHPLIKASDRELSYTMMAGNVASFGFVLAFIAPPSWETCTTRIIGAGISFTLIYAPLMLKLIRIWRIFHAGRKLTRSPKFSDVKSQMIGCAILIIAVGVIVIPWVYTYKGPMVEEIDTEPGERERICRFPLGPFVTAIAINLAFLITCTVFAFKNRTLPNNFNESKFVAFFVYSTCVLWLAFIPAYFLTDNKYRVLFLCIMLIGNAIVCLCGLYVPKVYAIYFVENGNLHIPKSRGLFRSSSMAHGRSRQSQFLDDDDTEFSMHKVTILGTNVDSEDDENRQKKISVVSATSKTTMSSLKVGGKSNKVGPVLEKKVTISEGEKLETLTIQTAGLINEKYDVGTGEAGVDVKAVKSKQSEAKTAEKKVIVKGGTASNSTKASKPVVKCNPTQNAPSLPMVDSESSPVKIKAPVPRQAARDTALRGGHTARTLSTPGANAKPEVLSKYKAGNDNSSVKRKPPPTQPSTGGQHSAKDSSPRGGTLITPRPATSTLRNTTQGKSEPPAKQKSHAADAVKSTHNAPVAASRTNSAATIRRKSLGGAQTPRDAAAGVTPGGRAITAAAVAAKAIDVKPKPGGAGVRTEQDVTSKARARSESSGGGAAGTPRKATAAASSGRPTGVATTAAQRRALSALGTGKPPRTPRPAPSAS